MALKKKSSVILPPGKTRLFRIAGQAARKLFPDLVKEAVVDMEDVSIEDIDWFIDVKGRLWSNDAYESRGRTFFCLSKKDFELPVSQIELV